MSNLELLKVPFAEEDIEWRLAQCGTSGSGIWAKCLAYIDSRAGFDRLDEVVGMGGWRDSYEFVGDGVLCHLEVKVGDEWVRKTDGSEKTDIESFKGGISGAFKRAAAKWGVGRYLYNLTETFAQVVPKGTRGSRYGKTKDGKVFYWLPPSLPDWATPEKSGKAPPTGQLEASNPNKLPRPKGELAPVKTRTAASVINKIRKGELVSSELKSYAIPVGSKKGVMLKDMTNFELSTLLGTVRRAKTSKYSKEIVANIEEYLKGGGGAGNGEPKKTEPTKSSGGPIPISQIPGMASHSKKKESDIEGEKFPFEE